MNVGLKHQNLFATLLTLVSTVTGGSQTPPTPSQPAPPPQVKQTVDAVAGHWVGSMTAVLPGPASDQFPWEMTCKTVARGSGAACAMTGTASIGPIEEACLVAYDPEGKAVHFMCVTSMREVHDHKGRWTNDREIQFEPYKTSMAGQPVTEDVTFAFPNPNRIKTRSVITTEDGSRMTFEFSGIRR